MLSQKSMFHPTTLRRHRYGNARSRRDADGRKFIRELSEISPLRSIVSIRKWWTEGDMRGASKERNWSGYHHENGFGIDPSLSPSRCISSRGFWFFASPGKWKIRKICNQQMNKTQSPGNLRLKSSYTINGNINMFVYPSEAEDSTIPPSRFTLPRKIIDLSSTERMQWCIRRKGESRW